MKYFRISQRPCLRFHSSDTWYFNYNKLFTSQHDVTSQKPLISSDTDHVPLFVEHIRTVHNRFLQFPYHFVICTQSSHYWTSRDRPSLDKCLQMSQQSCGIKLGTIPTRQGYEWVRMDRDDVRRHHYNKNSYREESLRYLSEVRHPKYLLRLMEVVRKS